MGRKRLTRKKTRKNYYSEMDCQLDARNQHVPIIAVQDTQINTCNN